MVTVDLEDLRGVYEYARHFDVDDDEAMQRIRKAIEDADAAEASRARV